MPISAPLHTRFFQQLRNILFLSLLLVPLIFDSCSPFGIIPKNYQKDKPFVTKNTIEVKGGKFTNDELIALKSRLNAQLDDSAKINVVDHYFLRHVYNSPPAFDTAYAGNSARNMKASMLHLGYYNAKDSFEVDTIRAHKQIRVHVKYIIEPGKPTLIDTISYHLRKTDLQEIAINNINNSLVEEGKPVTRAAVLGEISRLVSIYHDSGYYRFTAEELKMRGDTTLAALTTISDDPFEQLQLLAMAQQQKDSPKIKLALVLNPPKDTNRLKQYYINNIYILPDYQPGDTLTDPSLEDRVTRTNHYIVRFHNKLFRTGFLTRHVTLKKGDLYSQAKYYETLNNFSRTGVWQSVNIETVEIKEKDSVNKLNLIIQLIPAKQFSRELSIEASYSATSNTNSVSAANAGNLLGLSGNASLTNRNLRKEGIKMTTTVSAGVEFNLSSNKNRKGNLINSNEVSISNSIVIPRFTFPFAWLNKNKKYISPQTFIDTKLSYINRINLFDLQSSNLGIGFAFLTRKGAQVVIKPFNVEFTRLYNETSDFKATLDTVPFLRYSFNTALVAGLGASYSHAAVNKRHIDQQHSIKINLELSGYPIFTKYLRRYVKLDGEYVFSKSKPKSAFVFRAFAGVGIASPKDTTLPFFKQYYGGGSNSMRGWPIRGIGRGSQPLAPYGTNRFNDRTGDMQFELNPEFRFNIVPIIPNTMVLKGALFIDAGNVWNLRNSKPGGGTDSAQFKIQNFWKEMGINAGTGLRLDFNYFVVRLDFGFRFKRPELSDINNGWKIPALSFNDVLPKIFAKGANEEYRRWRYENFNFTIGINYPF